MIHLGANPVKGGRPPRDNKFIKIMIMVGGAVLHTCDKDSVVRLLFVYRVINNEMVNMM